MPEPEFAPTEPDADTAADDTADLDDGAVYPPPHRRIAVVAVAALVISLVAAGMAGAALLRPSVPNCQVAAWDAVPRASEIPTGWTISATDIYPDNQTTTIRGPVPASGSNATTVFAVVTCFGDRAVEAISRSEQASEDAGRAVTPVDGIGDAGFAIPADASGASALQFRRGALVVYIASSGAISQADLRQIGSAVDAAARRALGDAAATAVPIPSPAASPAGSPSASAEPSGLASPQPSAAAASPAAPELEALMPHQVSGTALAVQSATGDQVLGTDAASKALISALASFGKKPADLQVAQAYDPSSALDVTILGFRVPGIPAAKLEPAVLQTWLFAGATGVTTKQTSVSGVAVTEVSYSGDTSVSYVVIRKDAVLVVQSDTAALAAAAIAALP